MSTTARTRTRNHHHHNRKRFSDDQIKSLESIFSSESKPEIRRKQHLAASLGLHPRQVAIWFQNKRARSKSKQIQRDYTMLKSNHDKLASQLEDLKEENKILLIQVQRLRKMADIKGNGEDECVCENQTTRLTQDVQELNQEVDCLGMELEAAGADVMNTIHFSEDSVTSIEEECSFEPCTFLEDTGSESNWWDF